MKNFLGTVLISLMISVNAFSMSDQSLSSWYQTCSNAGHGHKYCKCNVEVMDNKLSEREFEKLISQSWKIADSMFENVIPICGYPND